MSFIEGVGDEVTAFTVLVLVVILAATVTFIRSQPFFSTINLVDTPEIFPQSDEATIQQDSQIINPPSTLSSFNDGHAPVTSPENGVTASSTSPNEEVTDASGNRNGSIKVDHSEEQCHSGTTGASDIYPELPNRDLPSAPEEEDVTSNTGHNTFTEPGQIRVRFKFLDDTERTVTSIPTAKIGDFKRTHFPEDVANNKIVRFIFSGQLLRDDATLQHYGVLDNCVIHVQILQAQTQQNTSQASQNTDLDLSHLLWPLLSVILGMCWVLYFKYPEFFNKMSVGILVLFTGSFAYYYHQMHHQ